MSATVIARNRRDCESATSRLKERERDHAGLIPRAGGTGFHFPDGGDACITSPMVGEAQIQGMEHVLQD